MTDQQPTALRLADLLESVDIDARLPEGTLWAKIGGIELDEAAAELRRLHEENEHLKLVKSSFEMKLATRGYELQIDDLKTRIASLEKALTQAAEALDGVHAGEHQGGVEEALATARQTLGGAA